MIVSVNCPFVTLADAQTCGGEGVAVQVLGSGGPELQDKRASSNWSAHEIKWPFKGKLIPPLLLLTDTVQGALLLAHEFLEGLGPSAAERRNRGGRLPCRRTGGRGADRPPEL